MAARNPADKAQETTSADLDDLLGLTDDDTPATEDTAVPDMDDLLTQPAPPVEIANAPKRKPGPKSKATVASIEEPVVEAPVTAAPVEESEEDREIRELRAQLSAPSKIKDSRPVSEAELTPKQKEARMLRDQLAQRKATEVENADAEYEEAAGETILIHILEDGITLQGQVWYRGQEIEFEVGGRAHKQTLDRNGDSWLDLRDDIDKQYDRYGKQVFASGPWRGKGWDAASHPDATPEELATIAAKEAQRRRSAPLLGTR